MSMATRYFAENVNLIGNPAGQSRDVMVNWNLNHGLRALADEIAALRSENQQIRNELSMLRQIVSGLR